MIWVDDVQQGSQVDWPLQHATALLGLRGSCACNLLLTAVGGGPKIDAVLEFFCRRTSRRRSSSSDRWTRCGTTSRPPRSWSCRTRRSTPRVCRGRTPRGRARRGSGLAVVACGERGRLCARAAAVGSDPRGASAALQQTPQGGGEGPRRGFHHPETHLPPLRHRALAAAESQVQAGEAAQRAQDAHGGGNFVPRSQWPRHRVALRRRQRRGYDAGGSMHGGSMMDASQRGGSMMTGSMMSGQAEDVDPYAAGARCTPAARRRRVSSGSSRRFPRRGGGVRARQRRQRRVRAHDGARVERPRSRGVPG